MLLRSIRSFTQQQEARQELRRRRRRADDRSTTAVMHDASTRRTSSRKGHAPQTTTQAAGEEDVPGLRSADAHLTNASPNAQRIRANNVDVKLANARGAFWRRPLGGEL